MKNIICLWWEDVADIPAGWALCDGNNGTPDLRGVIPIGAGGAFTPGDTAPTNLTLDNNIPFFALCFIMKVP